MDCGLPGPSVAWNSPGKNTGVGLPNPGLTLSLLHCRQVLYHLSHQGSPPLSQSPILIKAPALFCEG